MRVKDQSVTKAGEVTWEQIYMPDLNQPDSGSLGSSQAFCCFSCLIGFVLRDTHTIGNVLHWGLGERSLLGPIVLSKL